MSPDSNLASDIKAAEDRNYIFHALLNREALRKGRVVRIEMSHDESVSETPLQHRPMTGWIWTECFTCAEVSETYYLAEPPEGGWGENPLVETSETGGRDNCRCA